jgi:hypothetical protein
MNMVKKNNLNKLTGFLVCAVIVLISLLGYVVYDLKKNTMIGVASQQSSGRIVSFNVVKFLNAQKMYLADGSDPNSSSISSDAIVLFNNVKAMGPLSRKIIREIAGEGAVVVVTQSVVMMDNVPDITDEVLVRLGLPVDVMLVDELDVKGSGNLAESVEELLPEYMRVKPITERYSELKNSGVFKKRNNSMP